MYVQQAQGLGIAYFAKKMLQDKGMSLEGKRCIITGSNATALALAEKLTELGAVPLTFSDTSGGFDTPISQPRTHIFTLSCCTMRYFLPLYETFLIFD